MRSLAKKEDGTLFLLLFLAGCTFMEGKESESD